MKQLWEALKSLVFGPAFASQPLKSLFAGRRRSDFFSSTSSGRVRPFSRSSVTPTRLRGARYRPKGGSFGPATLLEQGFQYPGAFSIWSNQSKPISLTMRFEMTINRASDVAWSLKCWWMVNGGT